MSALHEHAASAKHDPKLFHCPVDLMPRGGGGSEKEVKAFSTLGGLTQHVESEACKGGKKMLETAMEFVQERLRELGFEGVRLLK